MSPQAVLKINDLTLLVNIGCTAGERLRKQEVRISFQIKPKQLPGACFSDKLEETTCYETLIGSIISLSEFKTVEKMGYDCFQILKKQLPPDTLLSLSIKKVSPPIDHLQGGIDFELSDEGFQS